MEYTPVSQGVAANAQPYEGLVGAEAVKQCPRSLHLQVVAPQAKPQESLVHLQPFSKILSTLGDGEGEGGRGLCVCVCVCMRARVCVCVCMHAMSVQIPRQ